MDMKKLKNKVKTGSTSFFDRLPEDLLLSILSRIGDDLKFLCQCSLVSKRFASTIYHIQTVSVTIPIIEMQDSFFPSSDEKYLIELFVDNSEEITRFIHSSSYQKLKFFVFLQNFKKLKSIHLEFTRPITSKSLLKWKVKCGNNEPLVESFGCVFPDSICKNAENGFDDDEELEDREFLSKFVSSQFENGLRLPIKSCSEWVFVVYLLVKCHHSLESVTITNSEKYGELVVRDEQIVEWRKSSFSLKMIDFGDFDALRMGWFPEVRLPSSGYVMKRVLFAITSESDDAVSWEYGDGEEKMLGEAVREILTNHQDMILSM